MNPPSKPAFDFFEIFLFRSVFERKNRMHAKVYAKGAAVRAALNIDTVDEAFAGTAVVRP
jgi:hypothetical protein